MLCKRVRDTEKKLCLAQRCVPYATMIANCKALSNELDTLHQMMESYYHIRSRSNELWDGDKNSRYNHYKASMRIRRNMIKGLNSVDGSWKTSKTDLEKLVTAYYENLFATNSPSGSEEALAKIGSRVTVTSRKLK